MQNCTDYWVTRFQRTGVPEPHGDVGIPAHAVSGSEYFVRGNEATRAAHPIAVIDDFRHEGELVGGNARALRRCYQCEPRRCDPCREALPMESSAHSMAYFMDRFIYPFSHTPGQRATSRSYPPGADAVPVHTTDNDLGLELSGSSHLSAYAPLWCDMVSPCLPNPRTRPKSLQPPDYPSLFQRMSTTSSSASLSETESRLPG